MANSANGLQESTSTNNGEVGDAVASTSSSLTMDKASEVATSSSSTSTSSSKKKKKSGKASSQSQSSAVPSSSSSSGVSKGKATLDKLKSALSSTTPTTSSRQDAGPAVTNGDDDDENVNGPGQASTSSSVVQGKKSVPSISDDLYRKIKQNAAAAGEDVSKLDKQSVAEMVEGASDFYTK